jgi:3-oxoacyl-[acyl-carrier-protein] synthase II
VRIPAGLPGRTRTGAARTGIPHTGVPRTGAVAVTAWSLHLPGIRHADVIPGLVSPPGLPGGEYPACPPEKAHELLGRKGLLNKDAATRLALCAVHRALGLRPRAGRAAGPPDPRVAVVASSNLGNVGAVIDVVRAVRAGRRKEISPLAAPGASSNVLSSAVAIWFGFGGPNLMLCSGAPSGIDAVAAGARLVRAGRADRVIVVGAEPADEVAAALHGLRGPDRPPLREGAAAVVLQAAEHAPAAPQLLTPVPGDPPQPAEPAVPAEPVLDGGDVILVTASGQAGSRPGRDGRAITAAPVIDLAGAVGDLYGALGVAQTAVAAAIASAYEEAVRVRIVCGDAPDGWRTADVVSEPV